MVFDFELLSHLHVTVHAENFNDSHNGNARNPNDEVTLWHIDTDAAVPPTATVRRVASLIRPPEAVFAQQLNLVDAYSDLRGDREGEILAQLTPPAAFWSSILYLHPDRRRWTLELLDVALGLAGSVEQRFKHALASRRPLERSPQIQPIILTPGHSTFPSGHSTEAFTIAYVLWSLQRAAEPTKDFLWLDELMRQAARVAINRTIAGVHYPVDSAAGQLLGLTLGDYLVRRCGIGAGSFVPWRFDGGANRYLGNADFDWRLLFNAQTGQRLSAAFTDQLAGVQAPQLSPLLQWLWNRAVAEWP